MGRGKGRHRGGLSVLAVDDHDINRDFLRAALAPHVRELVLAESGNAAIRACRERGFDVVLMDLHMPDMDGVTAWEHIRRSGGGPDAAPVNTRVVALTADNRPEERERLREAGFSGFLGKPVSLELLLETLDAVASGTEMFAQPRDESTTGAELLDDERARRAAGSPVNAARVRAAFLDDLDGEIRQLDRALRDGRLETATERLHRLQGACGYAGANRLEQACRRLEHSLRHGLDSSPGTLYVHFVRSAESTKRALERAGRNPDTRLP